MNRCGRFPVVVIAILLISGGWYLPRASGRKKPLTVDDFSRIILIGQVYPTGNIYLKNFTDELAESSEGPKYIAFRYLYQELGIKTSATRFRGATFDTIINPPSTVGNRLSYFNIPGMERMGKPAQFLCDPTHQIDSSLQNLPGGDFFDTMGDFCMEDTNIAVFKSDTPVEKSFTVVAVGEPLFPDKPKASEPRRKRPLLKREIYDVMVLKKSAEKELCSTTPVYIDSAIEIMTMKFKKTNFKIRISEYKDPGCYGDLSTTYILDVFEDDVHKKRFDLSHNQGRLVVE